jgi:hypothetical protein
VHSAVTRAAELQLALRALIRTVFREMGEDVGCEISSVARSGTTPVPAALRREISVSDAANMEVEEVVLESVNKFSAVPEGPDACL